LLCGGEGGKNRWLVLKRTGVLQKGKGTHTISDIREKGGYLGRSFILENYRRDKVSLTDTYDFIMARNEKKIL
jgi:hypothetical protein